MADNQSTSQASAGALPPPGTSQSLETDAWPSLPKASIAAPHPLGTSQLPETQAWGPLPKASVAGQAPLAVSPSPEIEGPEAGAAASPTVGTSQLPESQAWGPSPKTPAAPQATEAISVDLRDWLRDRTLATFLEGFPQAAWPDVVRSACLLGVLCLKRGSVQAQSGLLSNAGALRELAASGEPGLAHLRDAAAAGLLSPSSSFSSLSSPTTSEDDALPQAAAKQHPMPAVAPPLKPPPAKAQTANPASKAQAANPAYVMVAPKSMPTHALAKAAEVPGSPRASGSGYLPKPDSPWRLPEPGSLDAEMVNAWGGGEAVAAKAQQTSAVTVTAVVGGGRKDPLPHMAPGTVCPPFNNDTRSSKALAGVAEDCMNAFIIHIFSSAGKGGPLFVSPKKRGYVIGGAGTPPSLATVAE